MEQALRQARDINASIGSVVTRAIKCYIISISSQFISRFLPIFLPWYQAGVAAMEEKMATSTPQGIKCLFGPAAALAAEIISL